MSDLHRPAAFQGDKPAAAQHYDLADLRELALVAVERTQMPSLVTDPRQPDNPIILANKAFLELTGYASNEVIGRNCRLLQGDETEPAAVTKLRSAIERGDDLVEVEILNYRKDGTSFVNDVKISAVRNERRELLYYFASQKDVSAERKAEALEASERRLLKEVDHRTMNALALVQSIVSLSHADSVEGLSKAINRRVMSLAQTHRLLAERQWQSISLVALISAQIACESASRCIELQGQDIQLRATVAQPVGLVIHELVSNARSHGAMIEGSDNVVVKWHVAGDSIIIGWSEKLQRPNNTCFVEAFGLKIIRSVVEAQLCGSRHLELQGDTLLVTMTIPHAVAQAA